MIVEERARAVPAVAPERRSGARAAGDSLGAVLSALPVVAVVELLLMRTFYRVGIFVPKDGAFRTVYSVLTVIGSFAFNLASVLAFVALGFLVVRAMRRGHRAVGVVLLAFWGGAMLAALPGAEGTGPAVRVAFATGSVLLAWPFVRREGPIWERLAVAASTAAVLASSYAGAAGDARRLAATSTGAPGTVGAQLLGEAVLVVAAFLFFAAWVRDRGIGPRALALGAFPAAVLLVAWWANGAITGILVLWTAGLRLYLPVWLYALALWAFVAAAVGRLGDGSRRAGGMALLLVAGFLLESTYVQTLTLVALALLTNGLALGGVRADEPAG